MGKREHTRFHSLLAVLMKSSPSLALVLCFALCGLPGVATLAAQPPAKAEAAQGKVSKPAAKAQTKPAGKAKARAKPKAKAVSKEVAKPLPAPKVDLSLPSDMVRNLKPDVSDVPPARKPLLPAMFPDKSLPDDSPFQLNGRLISNEMQLQLRNDSRRDVEGAAIDFEFRN